MRGERRPRFFYGWIIVAACTVASGSYGLFWAFGIFFKELQAEFGWSATLTSSIHAVHMGVLAFGTILMGWLTDRYGPRRVLLAGALVLGGSFAVLSQVQAIWHFYLLYIAASLVVGFSLTLTQATVQRWFVRWRGLTLGIVAGGVGLGTMVLGPLSNHLIGAYGWRTAYIIIGTGAWVILSLAALALVRGPEQMGLRPYGAEILVNPAPTRRQEEWGAREAIKTRTMALFCGIRGFAALPPHLIMIHIYSFALALGVGPEAAAGAVGLLGLMNLLGRIGGGRLTDWIGSRKGLMIFCGIPALALLWLIGVRNPWMLYVFVVFFGLPSAASAPAVSGWTSELFGTRSLAALIGIEYGVACIGGALGPLIGGLVWDRTRSYTVAFLVASICYAASAMLVPLVRPPRKRSQPRGER